MDTDLDEVRDLEGSRYNDVIDTDLDEIRDTEVSE